MNREEINQIRNMDAALSRLASFGQMGADPYANLPSAREVPALVAKALRSIQGLDGPPVLIDTGGGSGNTLFVFRVKAQVLDSQHVSPSATSFGDVYPTRLGITPKRFKQALDKALKTIGAAWIDVTDYPVPRKSYVSALGKRSGEKPVVYFDDNTYTFEFYLEVRNDGRYASMDREAIRVNQIQALLSQRGTFGVLSAYGPGSKSENKERHGDLVRELQLRGYRFYDFKGSWEGVSEKSVLVPNIDWKDLLELGRKYDQVSVIYKSKDGVVGMYYLRTKHALVAVDLDNLTPAAQVSYEENLYSKGRGVSFEFDFLWDKEVPWNGSSIITAKQVSSMVEAGIL